METVKLGGIPTPASRIGLGTWSIGGWMWGGSDSLAVRTLERSLDLGVNFWDTAPVYGHGRAEELVGEALKLTKRRDRVVVATKLGLDWSEPHLKRDAGAERVRKEVHDSLRRLGTDYIDLIQIHWPDSHTPAAETVQALVELQREGLVLALGVSNYSAPQMEAFRAHGLLVSNQVPYNVLEREPETTVFPYCRRHRVLVIVNGALCRGLLSGRSRYTTPGYAKYGEVVDKLDSLARRRYKRRVIHLAMRWLLDGPVRNIALWGARRPEQLNTIPDILGWRLDAAALQEIDDIVNSALTSR